MHVVIFEGSHWSDFVPFTLTRPEFNGCTHVDNYVDPNAADENWKLPDSLKFTVTDITGLSANGTIPGSPATATLVVDVFPDCSIVNLPPELTVGDQDHAIVAGHEHADR